MPASRTWWGRDLTVDRAWSRTLMLYQLTTAMMALFSTILAVAMGGRGDLGLLLSALVMIGLLTGAAIIVPWAHRPSIWSALMPVGDVLAIALMRASDPTAGYTLLWVFPALWLAGSFGTWGVATANLTINSAYWFTVLLDSQRELTPSLVLVPLMIGAITGTSYIASRRAAHQRSLLEKQTRLLEHSAERARRQEETLTEVLDSVDFGVIRIGPEGEESMRNEAHGRMQLLLGPDDRRPALYAADGVTVLDADETPLARARRGEVFKREQVWYGRPGTGRRALSVTSRALMRTDGERAGGILVSRDVTEEVTALRARDDLVASVSHELRTPLTSILGYLELVLEMDDLPARARRGLDVAERNATRLLAIVADILTVAADDRDGIRPSITPVSTRVDEVVRSAVEALTSRADERGMSIDCAAVEDVTAIADPLRVRQVTDNLLSNAIKYGAAGGRIDVGVTRDRDSAWIVVRDDGPGISEEELPRVFERFFRSDVVRRTSTHGSGLGLSISRDIVRAHGGDITVRSAAGEGATFIVRLPLRTTERRTP